MKVIINHHHYHTHAEDIGQYQRSNICIWNPRRRMSQNKYLKKWLRTSKSNKKTIIHSFKELLRGKRM